MTRHRDRNFTFNQLAKKYTAYIVNQKGAVVKRVRIAELVREFGGVKLSRFTLAMVEEWQSRKLSEPRPPLKGQKEQRPPYKPASVNRALACLKHMFTKLLIGKWFRRM